MAVRASGAQVIECEALQWRAVHAFDCIRPACCKRLPVRVGSKAMKILLLSLIAVITVAPASLAESGKAATKTASVLPHDWWEHALKVTEPSVSSVAVDNGVIELRTDATPATPWAAQLVSPVQSSVRAGDLLVLEGEFRAAAVDPDTGEAAVRIVYQRSQPPYTVSDECVVQPTSEWKHYRLPFRANSFAADEPMQLALQFGTCRQRVHIRGLTLRNLGDVSKAGLRSPRLTYAGREPAAPWRAAAAQRIEKLRKSDLIVQVTDRTGQPIAGATVSVELTKHAFPFGTAVTTGRLLGDTPDDEKYREILKKYFNAATFEWEMKWQPWEAGNAVARQAHRDRTHEAVDWLRHAGFSVRGHCLVWPELSRLPPEVQELVRAKKGDALAERVNMHIDQMMAAFAGKVDEWDVVNEPTFHTAIQQVLGEEAMADWFRRARRADPVAALALNDFAMLSYGALNESKIARTYELVRALRESGSPIGVIGEQAHMDDVLVGPERVLHLLDRFGSTGLAIRITEFDVSTDDEQLQADYLRDFFTAVFSHASVSGITQWGFYEKNHWRPAAALWRADWSARPAGEAYVDLITRKWHTSATGKTDGDGRFTVRGFHGSYRIQVEHPGGRVILKSDLPARGVQVPVELPE